MNSAWKLPPGYSSHEVYFADASRFLEEYRWIYDFPVTELLVRGVLGQIPPDWAVAILSLNNQNLNDLPRGFVQEDWPPTLVEFSRRCQALKIPAEQVTELSCPLLPKKMCRGLTPKKQHEVACLAALVAGECNRQGVTHVLDVGAGMGYLGGLLHQQSQFHVLGLERDAALVEAARRRTSPAVQFAVCDILCSTSNSVEAAMQSAWGAPHQTCVTGLHACGDLSVDTLRLFVRIPHLHLLVLVPCCYHRMRLQSCGFPLSKSLHRALNGSSPAFLDGPFLRLASQETSARWQQWTEDEHKHHSLQVMARAVLQLYAYREGVVLRKMHRRAVRKTQRSSFENYIDDALQRFEFVAAGDSCSPCIADARRQVTELWHKHRASCRNRSSLWRRQESSCSAKMASCAT
ncbi:methyltransferase-like protein 25B isoform X2 [Periplaneta americana]|uniref:methyltransferase-like protein 25B isoform X2 n=1 Tax=Periplaneta americana TaxID=6978 RepID=UPI0037E95C84